jgi:spermidine synthase
VIGGGDGGCARELLRYPELSHIDLVEIDEKVIRASKEFLPALARSFDSPKVHLKVENGVSFVENQNPASYDLIIIDGSDPVGVASQLFEEAFYQSCAKLLTASGMIVAQAESPMFHEKTFVNSRKILEKVFGQKGVSTALLYAPTYPSGMWGLHFASLDTGVFERPLEKNKIGEFVAKENLHYYNELLHQAAFALPTFVKKMLKEEAL